MLNNTLAPIEATTSLTVPVLDHVNVRTVNLERMVDFYHHVLGLQVGERPPFNFDGAWLYSGDQAIVHLVKVSKTAQSTSSKNNLALEHFALRSQNLADFLAHLRHHRVPYRIGIVPRLAIRQVNIHDPDGNHIHIDFAAHEQADFSDYDGTD